jgi:7-cyano-7-deazaguanine synthase
MRKKAVVLVSGGLDSATVLGIAAKAGYAAYALSIDYGQRQLQELESACAVAASLGAIDHKIVKIGIGEFGGSALTDASIDVPTEESEGIPVTYVPARNTVFLSIALAWAEALEAGDIFIGANAVDYSGYPDCRPEFIDAFQQLANVATRAGIEGRSITVHAPLIQMSKADIIREGTSLGVDYALTLSCYKPGEGGRVCGQCDSCRIRSAGFREAGIADPAL